MRSKAAKVALCGVVSALSVVLMLMTGIVPIATIALPALAGCLTIAIVAETNVRYGFAVYCVVSVLAILLTPDREAILFYILFFGYYPTLYGLLMRIKRKPLRVLAKFGVFNLAMALETALAVWVLQIPLSEMEVFGKWSILILAVMLLLTSDNFILVFPLFALMIRWEGSKPFCTFSSSNWSNGMQILP